MEVLGDIVRQVGINDVLDVVLVSAFFWVILSWLWDTIPESALRKILIAAPVLGMVYILVRVFDLYLLESVIQVLFIVLLIVAVVVFQSDIRRMFDKVVGGISRKGTTIEEAEIIDTITETAGKLAGLQVGALMVVRGREPLDSHTHGGIELDGKVTLPLLRGIFDPETPGHDGALLIEDNRITRFAVHLPLATELPEVSHFGGTRHAAALGLAQVSDALVIVVSEERGTVGIAQNGRLEQDLQAADLKHRLEEFWDRHYRRHAPTRSAWWRNRHVQPATLSVLLAVTLWMFVVYSPDTVVRTLTVPIEYRNLPVDWALATTVPSDVQIVVTGPEQLIRRPDMEQLAVSIDLSNPQPEPLDVVIARDDLNLPTDVQLTRVEPSVLEIHMNRLESVHLPVRVPVISTLPDTLTLRALSADPDSARLMVTDGHMPRRIETMAVDLGRVSRDTTIAGRFVLPPGTQLPPNVANQVSIQIDVESN